MNNAEQYLKETESATIKLFEGIRSYESILHKIRRPVAVFDVTNEEEHRIKLDQWYKKNKKAIKLAAAEERKYINNQFALATLCGSVLQIAAMGIQWFSKNNAIPARYPADIRNSKAALPFCVGREVRDIHIGLIIFAGRNQFNHMNEKFLRQVNSAVFELLCSVQARDGNSYRDPAFDLNNPHVINYAHNITAILDWRSYKTYLADMKAMLL